MPIGRGLEIVFPVKYDPRGCLYLAGGLLALYTMMTGGVDTGWTFTTPLSTHYVNTNVLTTGLAAFIAGFS